MLPTMTRRSPSTVTAFTSKSAAVGVGVGNSELKAMVSGCGEPARRHRGGDEHRRVAAPKVGDGRVAVVLRHAAVQRGARQPLLDELANSLEG